MLHLYSPELSEPPQMPRPELERALASSALHAHQGPRLDVVRIIESVAHQSDRHGIDALQAGHSRDENHPKVQEAERKYGPHAGIPPWTKPSERGNGEQSDGGDSKSDA